MSEKFNFDYLMSLYQSDPDKFEQVRTIEIEKLINSAREKDKNRLTGLQFQIDAKRKIHRQSPVGACIAISKMMHSSFETLRCHLNEAASIKDPLGRQSMCNEGRHSPVEEPSKVIQFRR